MKRTDAQQTPVPEISGSSAELMYIKCAACGAWLDVKPGEMNRVSHSLCSDCYVKALAELATARKP